MSIAQQFIEQGYPKQTVLETVGVARSSFYYHSSSLPKRPGRPKSTHVYTTDGQRVSNEEVVNQIEELLKQEFVDYGYLKVTHYLRQAFGYIINHKKTYALMREKGLLNLPVPRNRSKRIWVKSLLPDTKHIFDYLEFDIKYFYVHGLRRNALLLSVIDVHSRFVLGHLLAWKITQTHVKDLFEQIFAIYPLPTRFYVRNDNGSQFEARIIQEYFEKKGVVQEFCKPATPQQNAHIESYHSILERSVCRPYEFDSIQQMAEILDRFLDFYNYHRIHSGIGYIAPYKYIINNTNNLLSLNHFQSLKFDCLAGKIIRA